MSQTAVTAQGIGIEGQIADAGQRDVLSRLAEGSLFFGRLAVLGTDPDRQAKHPAAAGDMDDVLKILGVVISSHHLESKSDGLDASYPDKETGNVMHEGRVLVKVEEAVSPTDAVFARHTANGPLTKLGAFRTDNDGGNAAAVPNARFITSAAADELAVLEITRL